VHYDLRDITKFLLLIILWECQSNVNISHWCSYSCIGPKPITL